MTIDGKLNTDKTGRERFYKERSCGGHWSAANIATMVLGFIIFAPLGFVILVWTLLGKPVQELPSWIKYQWSRFSSGGSFKSNKNDENEVFNEYQQTQYDRIREIKEEIKKRADAFREFRSHAQRRKDQKEFDDFMANKPENGV